MMALWWILRRLSPFMLTFVTEVRIFVGLTGYYRNFIKGLSIIASPLTQLTRQGVLFVWSEEYELSFEMLKEFTASYIKLIDMLILRNEA